MLVRLMQVFAIERAVDGLLALSAAADRADLAANAWAVPPRPADITDGAVHILSIGMETGESMRTHLFIKVVVEHDEKESPEKLGAELCRQLERNYIVREAELSSFSRPED